MDQRTPSFSIKPEFTARWSPRAFTDEEMVDESLLRGFEAARWSPSGGNSQPWRFTYARRGTTAFPAFTEFLNEGNRGWAERAAALVVLWSKKDFVMNGKWIESSSSSFDAGAGWMSFALQMNADGWASHGMAGIDRDKIRAHFNAPANYAVEMMIAVGRRGEPTTLPEGLRARETPSGRVPLAALVSAGEWPVTWT